MWFVYIFHLPVAKGFRSLTICLARHSWVRQFHPGWRGICHKQPWNYTWYIHYLRQQSLLHFSFETVALQCSSSFDHRKSIEDSNVQFYHNQCRIRLSTFDHRWVSVEWPLLFPQEPQGACDSTILLIYLNWPTHWPLARSTLSIQSIWSVQSACLCF